ncbi:aminotransferase class I/II-fold pyridoxal phosphate-dependent enzyme [Microbacterium soli]|uniref:Aminotransferase class I/II-fold pyridoxal phosphate-dependent enzyme n=1 Tax=Microbacterium soli TaxID=446075 RepID=A0ABP7NK03_9MICO
MNVEIAGTTAAEIADSVRALRERGLLSPGDALPPVRELAATLGVNRNTAVAAYRQLAHAGLVVSKGRGGTLMAGAAHVAQEGIAADTVLQDIGSGNPDPRLIPDPATALSALVGRPVLYGEPVIDPELERWAHEWMRSDLPRSDMRITVTSGAVDAVERLLAQALMRDDAVALEDPCFLASIHTVRLGGYRAVPIPVDEEGMTVEGLRAALDAGARAIISTPRAQNPTGVSLSPARAAALREVLRPHPYVLIIEDDHFSMLSVHPYSTLIGPDHRRYALLRSVSKFLGPDMCLALAATDPTTAERLALRLNPGTTWVSHLLQRLAHAQLSDPRVRAQIAKAAAHYAERNRAFTDALVERGMRTPSSDGLSVWVRLPVPARTAAARLMRRGWLVRTGDEFRIDEASPASDCLRLTVHDLDDDDTARLLRDLETAAR